MLQHHGSPQEDGQEKASGASYQAASPQESSNQEDSQEDRCVLCLAACAQTAAYRDITIVLKVEDTHQYEICQLPPNASSKQQLTCRSAACCVCQTIAEAANVHTLHVCYSTLQWLLC
jgi:hypothetical protein